MKLEEQVVNFELSKRLKELNVKQESLWWWVKSKELKGAHYPEWALAPYSVPGFSIRGIETGKGCLNGSSAFTVAELGEMLPLDNESLIFRTLRFKDGDYRCVDQPGNFCAPVADGKTEVDARAKMLIHLIEKGAKG